jgi:hypothetical protein
VKDAEACYRGLVDRGIRNIALSGDSAGGNLALALLSIATAQSASGGVLPVGTVALSPVTDLALSGASYETRAQADPYFLKSQAAELVRSYLGDADPKNPLASPLYGDLTALPPIRVHVGDDEVLLDDSRRYVERAVAAGVDARLDVWTGIAHGFTNAVGTMHAANQALDAIGAFLRERFPLRPKDVGGQPISNPLQTREISMTTQENTVAFTKTAPPEWLLAFWKEIDDKTFGKGFDCFTEDAVCNLGVADWHGREAIRKNLKAFIDTGFTAHHDVVEYWDGGPLKVFRGIVTMRPDDPSKSTVKPSMAHFFYMDKNDPSERR